MSRLRDFLEFLREYFKGPAVYAEYRELFISMGDPSTSCFRDRGVVWIHGLDTYITTYVRNLKAWNIFMGVGFVSDPVNPDPEPGKMLYDRLAFDFDDEANPREAVERALGFAKAIEDRYGATPLVFESGFKGAHVVVPLSRPVEWEVYQLLWVKLYSEMTVDQRKLVDMNMLQWNRVDRVPLTYNVKESGSRFCRIIYPKKFSWKDFKWGELRPLDPSNVRLVRVVVPQVIKPKIISSSKGRKWVWRVVEKGLPDGRKRFLLYVLIPYLVNINNKSEDEIFEICRTFLENSCKNHGNCDKIYDSWIRSAIRSAKSHGFKGFGLSKLKEKDPELYSIIEQLI